MFAVGNAVVSCGVTDLYLDRYLRSGCKGTNKRANAQAKARLNLGNQAFKAKFHVSLEQRYLAVVRFQNITLRAVAWAPHVTLTA